MQLLKVMLIGGQIHDSEPAIELLKSVAFKGKTILADKAYSCSQIRVFIAEHSVFVFPKKPISGLSMTLIQNRTNTATSSKGFFSASELSPHLHSLR